MLPELVGGGGSDTDFEHGGDLHGGAVDNLDGVLGYRDLFVLGIVLTLFIFFRHGTNIRRLRDGTEPKIGQK